MSTAHLFVVRAVFMFCGCLLSSACQEEPTPPSSPVSAIEPPASFPTLGFPEDNVPTEAKIELGRHLFYDKRLSGNQTYSCGTCHQQEHAFTDGLAVALGSTDEAHSLGSMTLTNVGYSATLGWGNPVLKMLEVQALIPMYGEEPVELGLNNLSEEELLERFRENERYQAMFAEAFPRSDQPISLENITKAIASFERSLISANSPYDRFIASDKTA